MEELYFFGKLTILGFFGSLIIILLIILYFSNSSREKALDIKNKYQNLFLHMNEGFALHRVVCDDTGEPVDYIFLDVNRVFEDLTGLKGKDIIGRSVKEVLPGTEDYWIKTFGQVAIDGNPISYQNFSKELSKHFKVNVYSPKTMEFATLFSDVTNQIDANIKINHEKQLLITILGTIMSGYWDRDLVNDTGYYSPSYKAMFGYEDHELENKPDLWKDLIHEDDLERSEMMYDKHVASLGQTSMYHEARYKHKDGSIVWVIKSGQVAEWDENNQPVRLVGCIINITKQKKLENALREEGDLFQTTLHSIADGVVSIDRKGIVQVFNQSAEEISGFSSYEVIGRNILDLLHLIDEKNNEEITCYIEDFIDIDNFSRDDLSITIKSGEVVPIEYSISQIINSSGKIDGAVMVFRDIREKRDRLNRISFLSNHDQLTGLYNRYYYEGQIENIIKEENLPLTLAIMDVNGLKLTNDAFGHLMGDRLLKTLSVVLKEQCRQKDMIFRVGGDEFVIMMPNTTEEEAKEVFTSIYRNLEKIKIEKIVISVSIGWATSTNKIDNMDDIYTKAEEFMYRKKIAEGQSMRNRTVKVILDTLNEKNKRERIHSQNVSKISRKIAEIMKFEPEVVKEIELAGLLHDIGKIAIDENILNKDGVLTESEYNQIKRHPECGYQIMKSADSYSKLADYILSHHERWDGMGYPRGLSGESIPLIARIINVADAYEAMTADRPYRDAMSHEEALSEINRCSGKQFDPLIADAFRDYFLEGNW
jgi:diguanylate cyclase